MIGRILLSVLLLAAGAGAQMRTPEGQTVVIMPFENESHAPGLEWIGEAFPEVIGERLAAASLFIIGRDDRLYAFDRVGIPANVHPSRATLYRIAEEMDADYAVLGRFTYDGQTFRAFARILDVKRLRLLPEVRESGSLLSLLEVQSALAWTLMQQLRPSAAGSRSAFVAATANIRLDAFENYIRGVTSASRQEKIRRFREALRLNPQYTAALLQLGKTYYSMREYADAAGWLARVPRAEDAAREAAFYQGLAHFYLGQFDKAEAAFAFVASRLPLTEVYNNLGVVTARRGRRALDYFQKAVEADPKDPDYRFNLAVALYRAQDYSGAARQLRESLALRPGDSEAKSLLDQVSGAQRAPNGAAGASPLERIKRNYEEASFRQLAFEIENATEAKLAASDPPSHARAHVEQGRQLLADGFSDEAEKLFREAVILDPAAAAGHAGLAACLERSGEAASARTEAAAAIRLQPSADAFLVLARLDLRDNKLQAAAANVDQALALEPASSAAQNLKRDIAARLAGGPTVPQP